MKIIYSLLAVIIAHAAYSQNNRPQEPKEPFGYEFENVVFENNIDSIFLAGTLTYPSQGSNFPAVILISGSGTQDRNSELMNHKPFWVIADYLTKNGIAVLRVDDRGVGESGGIHNETGLRGFVNDAKSALCFLKSRKEINQSKLGFIGHSMGGIIAPIIASESEDVSFVVLLAGTGMRGDKLMLLQKETIERKMLIDEVSIAMGQNNMRGAYDIILKWDGDKDELQKELDDYFDGIFGGLLPEAQLKAISEQLSLPWLADFIRFDPFESLSKTKCSVLALNGSNDLQVPSKENLEAIKKILTESGNNDVEIMELEGLNHLFQESETGLPNEYSTIEQTFSPKALEAIVAWIKEKVE